MDQLGGSFLAAASDPSMRHYTIHDAVKDRSPEFICLNFCGCTSIEPDAVDEIVRYCCVYPQTNVMVQVDDHVELQLDALKRILADGKAEHSLCLEGSIPLSPGLNDLVRSIRADIFADDSTVQDENFAASIGFRRRNAVILKVPEQSTARFLRHLRSLEHLSLRGLRRLDTPEAEALLHGNEVVKDLELPHLQEISIEAARLIGQANLNSFRVGPALHHSPEADGWLASSGLIVLHNLGCLTVSEADRLAASSARCISIDAPIKLSTAAARRLAKFPRTLSLGEQKRISPATAAGLTGWRQTLIIQTQTLSSKAASHLYSDRGELDISLGIMDGTVHEEEIIALASTGGAHTLRLSLPLNYALTERAAAAIASHRGEVHLEAWRLQTRGVWPSLALLRGELHVHDVTLNPEAAAHISRHRGPLSLDLSEMPCATTAALLSEHRGGSLRLSFRPFHDPMSVDVAMQLAKYEGQLTLYDLHAMDEGSVHALEHRRGNLNLVSYSPSPMMKHAIDYLRGKGTLCPLTEEPSVKPWPPM